MRDSFSLALLSTKQWRRVLHWINRLTHYYVQQHTRIGISGHIDSPISVSSINGHQQLLDGKLCSISIVILSEMVR